MKMLMAIYNDMLSVDRFEARMEKDTNVKNKVSYKN